MTVIDINIIYNPYEVRKYYVKELLITDIIAIVPYNLLRRYYIFIRLIRTRILKDTKATIEY